MFLVDDDETLIFIIFSFTVTGKNYDNFKVWSISNTVFFNCFLTQF